MEYTIAVSYCCCLHQYAIEITTTTSNYYLYLDLTGF